MTASVAGPTFALIGVGGYIARRHLEAIREVGGTLIACHDLTDSVGILDSYFPDARFFTDGTRFEDFLSQPGSTPDYFVVCTPNDLHTEHAALGLRIGADVILEKPPAMSGREVEALTALQAESGHAGWPRSTCQPRTDCHHRVASHPVMMRAIRGPDAPSHSGGSSPAYRP